MKPVKKDAKTPFRLCRKHIGLDLTETSIFTEAKTLCLYCKREYQREWERKRNPERARRTFKRIEMAKQVEMTKEVSAEKFKQVTNVEASQREYRISSKGNIYGVRSQEEARVKGQSDRDNLVPHYVRQKLVQHSSSLKHKDIPDSLVGAYTELMKLKRFLKNNK